MKQEKRKRPNKPPEQLNRKKPPKEPPKDRGASKEPPKDRGPSKEPPVQRNGRKPSGVRRRRRRRKRSGWKKAGIFAGVFLGLLFLTAMTVMGAYLILDHQGKKALQEKQEALPSRMSGEDTAETLPAGAIRYHGKTYGYKQDIITFLCMGIDRNGEAEASEDLYQGGQADALFLAVLDSQEKKISLIAVNRDTMTEISVFDRNGLYAGKETAQIALAHAYGDGLEDSCENTVEAVSNLFYGIPIHGYFALNMEAVNILNDAVGGVTVTIPESAANADMEIGGKRYKTGWQTGQTVHLMGNDAYTFIRYRDVEQSESADARLARQKQYLQAFAAQVKTAVRTDLTLPVKLYGEVTPYMVTDISAEEAVYLAGEAIDYTFSEEDIYSMQGEVKMGELFEEFYQDDTALYELILDVFYEER